MRVTDDVDIRSGGVVAVDTATLRAVATQYDGLGARLDEVCGRLRAECGRLSALEPLDGSATRLGALAWRAERAADAATGLAGRLRHAATVYEIVDARAAAAAADAAGDAVAGDAARARVGALARDDPAALAIALAWEAGWQLARPSELGRQALFSPLSVTGAATLFGAALGLGVSGAGRVRQGDVLAPAAQAHTGVRLRRVASAATSAPASVSDAIGRVPQGDAQVRIERYTMPDGTRRFAVYIAGTRTVGGEGEPWDMRSNVELHSGHRSASYDATVQALRDAGARPGDALYEVGYSQGAMVTGHIAVQEGYDVRALIDVGSPVSTEVGDGTLSVQLRHTDDPVTALAGAGDPSPVGAPGSFVAERTADPLAGLQDLGLEAHHFDRYAETAALVDHSDDPRAAAVPRVFGELGDATSVDVFEYAATRAPVSGGGGE